MRAGLALGKATVNGTDAVTVTFLYRVSDKRHSAKRDLPINFFAVCSLSSTALGKGFAECNLAFAEYLRHSAKNLNPVVITSDQLLNLVITNNALNSFNSICNFL